MPNPGYANFTIKSPTARKLKELSQKNGVSLPTLINKISEKLDPDVKLDALLKALEFAPSLNFSQFLDCPPRRYFRSIQFDKIGRKNR